MIHDLASQFQDHLHLPDPTPLYVVLGTLAANMITGDPVWLMVIGPSSSGKTQTIMSTLALPHVHAVSDITGPGALLSGVSDKDKEKGAHGGILRKVGKRGAILMEDFTSTVMQLPMDTRKQIMSAFRLIYNGWYDRNIGGGGGRTLVWTGKIALLAGGTGVIDQMRSENSALGERWLYYRFPKTDGYGESIKAARNTEPDVVSRELRDLVVHFFNTMGLEWIVPCPHDCTAEHDHRVEPTSRDLTERELNRLMCISGVVTSIRNFTIRHYRTGEIVDPNRSELPPRLNKELAQLYRGMELIGLEPHERWDAIGKVAMDSVPELRAKVVELLRGGPMSKGEVRKRTRYGPTVIDQAMEDMEIFGIVELVDKQYRLTDKIAKELNVGWGRRA